jgi:hypothetical protein
VRKLNNSWAAILFFIGAVSPAQPQETVQIARTPVVVELFTSEGCSSCPPADSLLVQLDQTQAIPGVEVIALGHHVDYWDGIGWHDRFSSRESTLRQEQYVARLHLDSPYTPQIVVDGSIDIVGNDAAGVRRAIASAARSPKAAKVTVERLAEGIRIEVTSAPARPAAVMLAITENDLSTAVKGGENRGRELRHTAVVRSLHIVGKTVDGRFSAIVPPQFAVNWNVDHLNAVVFVQQDDARIVGAAMMPLANPHAN